MADIAALAAEITQQAKDHDRWMVGIAGPPGSGKSTFAEALVNALKAAGETAVVVPMDGFHYDDRVLEARGTRNRKGAPWTFDVRGFVQLLRRIRAREADVAIPVFDRSIELSRNAADIVNGTDRFIIAEGNYLLLAETPWDQLKPLFDFTVFLDLPLSIVRQRLHSRIRHYGHDEAFALHWMESNDLPNAKIVLTQSAKADLVIDNS